MGDLKKLFAFYFCLVKGKVAFLCVLLVRRKVRIYRDMERTPSGLGHNISDLTFRKYFSARGSLPNRPRDLGKGLQAPWPPSAFHVCGVAPWPISRRTSAICKRLPGKQQQSAPILNV